MAASTDDKFFGCVLVSSRVEREMKNKYITRIIVDRVGVSSSF